MILKVILFTNQKFCEKINWTIINSDLRFKFFILYFFKEGVFMPKYNNINKKDNKKFDRNEPPKLVASFTMDLGDENKDKKTIIEKRCDIIWQIRDKLKNCFSEDFKHLSYASEAGGSEPFMFTGYAVVGRKDEDTGTTDYFRIELTYRVSEEERYKIVCKVKLPSLYIEEISGYINGEKKASVIVLDQAPPTKIDWIKANYPEGLTFNFSQLLEEIKCFCEAKETMASSKGALHNAQLLGWHLALFLSESVRFDQICGQINIAMLEDKELNVSKYGQDHEARDIINNWGKMKKNGDLNIDNISQMLFNDEVDNKEKEDEKEDARKRLRYCYGMKENEYLMKEPKEEKEAKGEENANDEDSENNVNNINCRF